MFIQLNETTNHTAHISNHGELSTFIALLEPLKGGIIPIQLSGSIFIYFLSIHAIFYYKYKFVQFVNKYPVLHR